MKSPDLIQTYLADPDVHDEQRVGTATGLVFIAALLLFIAHALNAWLMFRGSYGFATALFVHILLSALAYLPVMLFNGSARENRFFLLLFITTATMSVFGAAGTMLTVMLHYWYMRFAQPFSQWFSSIFPSVLQDEPQRIYDDIIVGRDEASKPYSVIPFVDVLWYGSEAQKRMALSKMTSRFHPNFAPAFRKALNDTSNTIRVQAATAINKIENQFVAQLMKLHQVLNKRPNDPAVILAIASHCDDYAFTGILDRDRERHNRELALKYYTEYLDRKPGDQDVQVRVGRLLMRNREYSRAADWLRQSMDQGNYSQILYSWYAEALFASGRFAELRQLARTTGWQDAKAPMQPLVAEAVTLWGGSAAWRGERA